MQGLQSVGDSQSAQINQYVEAVNAHRATLVPQPKSQIESAMDDLANCTASVQRIIGRLKERLNPVLKPQSINADGTGASNGPAHLPAPLVCGIEQQVHLLRQELAVLEDMETRLAL
ncbi:hypothetical protein [Comamonas sp.]|uniref:hypothetical protein n=1 Tax=Comamonas sp. TaxID=34028 RepID=UPI0028A9E2B0|nr:hypothetical protein [Comamonas sp.]